MQNYELNKHKRSDRIKWIATALAGLLLVVACSTTIAMGVKHNGWFKKDDNKKIEQDINTPDSGGSEIADIQSNGIMLFAAPLSVDEYDTYGVSAQAENAYTLTATITPADAANKKVNWTIAFKDPSSAWATGKTVTDYATVTPSADGSLTAVVENVAAFGEQIVVKCTSRDNASAFATCALEYLQRTTGYTFNLAGKTYSTTGVTRNAVTPDFSTQKSPTQSSAQITVNKSSVYTRTNSDVANYFTIKATAAFKTALTNAGIDVSNMIEFSGNANQGLSSFFDKVWGERLYSNNTQKNKLIAAMDNFDGTAFEIDIFVSNGGEKLATFEMYLDTSVIVGQKGVESITVDQTEIVF